MLLPKSNNHICDPENFLTFYWGDSNLYYNVSIQRNSFHLKLNPTPPLCRTQRSQWVNLYGMFSRTPDFFRSHVHSTRCLMLSLPGSILTCASSTMTHYGCFLWVSEFWHKFCFQGFKRTWSCIKSCLHLGPITAQCCNRQAKTQMSPFPKPNFSGSANVTLCPQTARLSVRFYPGFSVSLPLPNTPLCCILAVSKPPVTSCFQRVDLVLSFHSTWIR